MVSYMSTRSVKAGGVAIALGVMALSFWTSGGMKDWKMFDITDDYASLYERQVSHGEMRVVTHEGIPYPFDYDGCIAQNTTSVCEVQRVEYERMRQKYIWERASGGERVPDRK